MRAPVVAALLLAGGAASAQVPNPSVHFGVFGGYHLISDDSDLRSDTVPRERSLDSGPGFGLRIGGNFNWLIGAELQVEDVATKTSPTGGDAHAVSFRAGLLFHFLRESEVAIPYATVGAGLYSLFSDDLGDDQDYLLTWGLGLKLMMTDWAAFRVQVDHIVQGDGRDASIANNFDFTGGFDFFVAFVEEEELPPPPADRDGDGVEDAADRCPLELGPPELRGCPDTDKDGVPDIDDLCMTDKGPVEHQGCPDTDGDGVADRGDRCPKAAGLLEFDGCPDSDGDGIPDDLDSCPLVAGVVEQGGCPAQPKPEVLQRFTGAIRGITFDTGKATIRATSFAVLDEAVAVLKEFPALQLVIEGHTDDRGPDAKNLTLSQERADAVAAYVVSRGVEPARLTAIGYGETRPMASNKTEAGRAENRRIEFRIIQPATPPPKQPPTPATPEGTAPTLPSRPEQPEASGSALPSGPEQPEASGSAFPSRPEQPEASGSAFPSRPEQPEASGSAFPSRPEQPEASGSAFPSRPEQPEASGSAFPSRPEQPEASGSAFPSRPEQPEGSAPAAPPAPAATP